MTSEQSLELAVADFEASLRETINGTLPGDHEFEVLAGPPEDEQRVTVRQAEKAGIPLLVGDKVAYRLKARFRCMWNSDRAFFTVNESRFTLEVEGISEPLIHFDYDRESSDDVPVAHLNFHAHRDELMWALMTATRHRGKNRDAWEKRGTMPRVSALHIPLGGHRFRPSIEDVLEMAMVEFGIETKATARSALDAGRSRFRSIQVSAATSDDPEMAADALRRMGYTVTPPDVVPEAKLHRLRRY